MLDIVKRGSQLELPGTRYRYGKVSRAESDPT
jgi:hypothetical protein